MYNSDAMIVEIIDNQHEYLTVQVADCPQETSLSTRAHSLLPMAQGLLSLIASYPGIPRGACRGTPGYESTLSDSILKHLTAVTEAKVVPNETMEMAHFA